MNRRAAGPGSLFRLGGAIALVCGLAGPAVRAAAPAPRVVAGLAGVGRLAATSNGQVVFCLDRVRGAVLAVDPADGGEVREVVAEADADGFRPVAIAALDTAVLAAVCRRGDDWELRTWRLRPDSAVPADPPLQRLPLGTADGDEGRVDLAVGSARNWLAVAGLPPPLAPVLRAPLARAQVGPLSSRSCPEIVAGTSPLAVAAGPRDEMVLVRTGPGGSIIIAYHDQEGRTLLALDTGLERIVDAGFAPGGKSLWAVGRDADGRSGLWRLEATLRGGKQAIRPVLVLPLADPLAVVAPTERSALVCRAAVAGEAAGPVERYDPPASAPGTAGAADEGKDP